MNPAYFKDFDSWDIVKNFKAKLLLFVSIRYELSLKEEFLPEKVESPTKG